MDLPSDLDNIVLTCMEGIYFPFTFNSSDFVKEKSLFGAMAITPKKRDRRNRNVWIGRLIGR